MITFYLTCLSFFYREKEGKSSRHGFDLDSCQVPSLR